jgi:hypothetical protein
LSFDVKGTYDGGNEPFLYEKTRTKNHASPYPKSEEFLLLATGVHHLIVNIHRSDGMAIEHSGPPARFATFIHSCKRF